MISYKNHMIGPTALMLMNQWAGMNDWINKGIIPHDAYDSEIVEAIENYYDGGITLFLQDYCLNRWGKPIVSVSPGMKSRMRKKV